jgi:hypothetical protein
MKELFQNPPDLSSPLNSSGGFSNGSGNFPIKRGLKRKGPLTTDPRRESVEKGVENTSESENSTDRYFGSFSIESKRHVWDLLKKHPQFGDNQSLRLGRIRNNTSEVLPNDPIKLPLNGGFTVYQSTQNNEPDLPGSGSLLKRSNHY